MIRMSLSVFGRGLVALADDDLAFLDRVKDRFDRWPGLFLPGFGFDLVERDVGGQTKPKDRLMSRPLFPGGELELVDLGDELVLGFLDVQNVLDRDDSFAPLCRAGG